MCHSLDLRAQESPAEHFALLNVPGGQKDVPSRRVLAKPPKAVEDIFDLGSRFVSTTYKGNTRYNKLMEEFI